jgi:hypothetical protein
MELLLARLANHPRQLFGGIYDIVADCTLLNALELLVDVLFPNQDGTRNRVVLVVQQRAQPDSPFI